MTFLNGCISPVVGHPSTTQQPASHLLACLSRCLGEPAGECLRGHGQVLEYQRLVESVPLISGLVRHPGSHHWTSYCSNALSPAGWLTPHRGAMGLLRRAAGGRTQYREFFESGFDAVRASALLRNLGAEGSILSARSYR